MGEDTDATLTLNRHGFLPDHNYVTEGEKKSEGAVCVWPVFACSLMQGRVYLDNL